MKFLKQENFNALTSLVRSSAQEANLSNDFPKLMGFIGESLSSGGIVVVNELEKPTCYAWATQGIDIATMTSILVINMIFTKESERGKGLGSAMVEKLKTYAEIKGVKSISVSARTPKAKDFWKKLNMTPDETHYRLEI